MPTILLIRHGENDYVKEGRLAGRLPGVHLNDKGRAQAALLAEKLKDAPIRAVYSSPLDRTMETAEPLAQALGLAVTPRPGLLEADMGNWQDRKLRGLSRLKAWRTVQFAPSLVRFPQGESFFETQMRIIAELEALRGQHKDEEMFACVFHSDPIKLAVAFHLGLPLDLFQRINVSPASVTALQVSSWGSRLLMLNYDFSLTFSKP
ncbi:MAG TPA: histidine phosphatase family protein [Anaerolineales bacterium]|nr:histidine phosphatase family protein [Anaerolineales bacterium]